MLYLVSYQTSPFSNFPIFSIQRNHCFVKRFLEISLFLFFLLLIVYARVRYYISLIFITIFITSIYILIKLNNYTYQILYTILYTYSYYLFPPTTPIIHPKNHFVNTYFKFFCKHIVNIIIFVLISFSLYVFLCYLSILSIFHNFSLNFFLKITKNFVKPLDKPSEMWYNKYIKERGKYHEQRNH